MKGNYSFNEYKIYYRDTGLLIASLDEEAQEDLRNNKDKATPSLNNLIKKDCHKDIHYGIKLCNRNIGFNGRFYTFPYFCAFLIKRFMRNV